MLGRCLSGVVVGATCTCRAADNLFDCREYSRNGSSRVLTRVEMNTTNSFFVDHYLKTCTQAGNILSPGIYCCIYLQSCTINLFTTFLTDIRIPLDTESIPDVIMRNETGYSSLVVCPFNEDYNFAAGICTYLVRVTEVFVGNINVSWHTPCIYSFRFN